MRNAVFRHALSACAVVLRAGGIRAAARCRRAGAEDRRRRRHHVDGSALLQPLPQQQRRRAHLRQARADGRRFEDDPRPRDVVEGDRSDDVGVQAAQGRQVHRRQRAHRRGRRVLDRPRAERARTARARSRPTPRRSSRRRSSIPTRSASSTRRRIRSPPNDLSTIYIVSKKVATGATTEDFNSGKAAIGSGRYKLVKYTSGDRVELVRNDNYWGEKSPWDKVTFKIIKNEPARVAALLSGDVDAIEQPPTADLARIKGDPKFTVTSKISHRVIYFNFDHLERVEPVHHRQGRQAARQESAARRARAPRDLQGDQPAGDRRPRDGRAGDAVGPARLREAVRQRAGPQGRRVRRRRREEADGRSRLSGRLQHHDPRPVGPLRQRREDRAGGRADALPHRHHREGRDGADGAVLRPRVEAGVQLPHGRLGRVDRRGVEPAALAARDVQPRQGPGRRQLGPLQQRQGRLPDRAGAAAGRRREPQGDAAERDQARDGRPRHHADPLPVHDLGDEEERRLHAAHRRVHARVPVQAGGRRSRDRREAPAVRARAGESGAVPRHR